MPHPVAIKAIMKSAIMLAKRVSAATRRDTVIVSPGAQQICAQEISLADERPLNVPSAIAALLAELSSRIVECVF
ncbi:MAG: hypothetical protein HOP09_17595 [Hyphomicrobium sp.]|nr:hypothetical protein [Hyphomicrobium sp.]